MAKERSSFRRGLILARNRNFFKERKKERKKCESRGRGRVKPLDLASVLKKRIQPAFRRIGITGVGWHTFPTVRQSELNRMNLFRRADSARYRQRLRFYFFPQQGQHCGSLDSSRALRRICYPGDQKHEATSITLHAAASRSGDDPGIRSTPRETDAFRFPREKILYRIHRAGSGFRIGLTACGIGLATCKLGATITIRTSHSLFRSIPGAD